jgi:hypothetical protein
MAFGERRSSHVVSPEPKNSNMNMETRLVVLLTIASFTLTTVAQNVPNHGAHDPHQVAEGSWVGITGQVESTSPGSFMLDYGDGNIKVQLEPTSTKKHDFIKDEQVRVYGVMDDGFFTAKTIKAHAVYVESLKSYACTTEGAETICSSFAPVIYSGVVVHGRVTAASPGTVQVDDGDKVINIDTSDLQTASGDKGMAPAAKEGDLVTVMGHMDEGFFSRKLKALSMEIVQ